MQYLSKYIAITFLDIYTIKIFEMIIIGNPIADRCPGKQSHGVCAHSNAILYTYLLYEGNMKYTCCGPLLRKYVLLFMLFKAR